MQFLTKVDQLKAQLEVGMWWLRIKTLGMKCRKIDSPFRTFKFYFIRRVKGFLAVYVEGILFDNFHGDMKVGIVMLFSFGIIRTL